MADEFGKSALRMVIQSTMHHHTQSSLHLVHLEESSNRESRYPHLARIAATMDFTCNTPWAVCKIETWWFLEITWKPSVSVHERSESIIRICTTPFRVYCLFMQINTSPCTFRTKFCPNAIVKHSQDSLNTLKNTLNMSWLLQHWP